MAQATPASTLDNLSRLAAKPGVQSTLVLSKADGSIIRSTGLLAAPSTPPPESGPPEGDAVKPDDTMNGEVGYGGMNDKKNKAQNVEEVARMVFTFMSGAREFAEGMNEGDEVKLLRLRTRKNEIVIVPDAKFLLVVFHDAPS